MAHFAPCTVDGIASLSNTPAPSKANMQPPQEQSLGFKDQLTWQQEEDLGARKPKRRNRARKTAHSGPLDTETATAQEPPALGLKPFVRQTKVKTAIAQPEAPGEAHTCVTLQQSKQPAPLNSPLPQDHDYAVAKKPRPNRKNRKNCKPNGEYHSADMSATPARAYIPPHLRKKYPALLSVANIGPTAVNTTTHINQVSLPEEAAPTPEKHAVVSQQWEHTEPRTEDLNLPQAKVSRNKTLVLRQDQPSLKVNWTGLSDNVSTGLLNGADRPASVTSQISKPAQSQVSPCDTNPKIDTPPSPPTTEEPPKAPALFACDDPQPKESHSPPRRNNFNWSRTPKPSKGKHVWLKARDIPKALSDGSQSDGGVNFRSDSDGDPSYDVKKLMDWSGDWLPAPEDWAARRGFTSRHFGQVIESWANEHSKNCTRLMDIASPDFLGLQDEYGKWTNKDLVPRYWLHESIDGNPPRKFWEEMRHRAPAPLSDIDITENLPYWERWSDGQPSNCFMSTLVVPEARIDQDDKDNELECPYAMFCVKERIAMVEAIKVEKQRRQHARRNKPTPRSTHEGLPLPDRQLRPKANIYLRPVGPADIPGIQAIYNYYVKETVHASELEEQTEAQIRIFIDGIARSGLPCLVAVSKRNQRKGPQGYVTEKIVGFTYLTDLADTTGMYRFTFELEVYVHPGFLRQGVGKCLLDQMVHTCNTAYVKRGGYEYVAAYEYLKTGHSRTIKTILADLHYEKGDDVEWATSYMGDFGFKRAGRLSQIGHKAGKVVDKVMFQMHTSEVVGPHSIPTFQS